MLRSYDKRPRSVSLALQGGGAHGALTWGVLDRLLADERLEIAAISGTSAGAMNGVVLADGYARGGREGARRALGAFWRGVSDAARLSPLRRGPWERLTGRYGLDHAPGYLLFEGVARIFSPYELNPLGFNPLRALLERQVDFDRLNRAAIPVHVTATNVRTGRPRSFGPGELTPDAVMASACLPQLYPAVEIDGEAYWDGGFTGNPALLPLIEARASRDIVIVQVNPVTRDPLPRTAREIAHRMNEIGFNASLVKELRALGYLERLLAEEGLPLASARRPLLHLIDLDGATADLSASSKLDVEWDYLRLLFDRGRERAGEWLAGHAAEIGRTSTLDLDALLADRSGHQRAAPPPRRRRWWRDTLLASILRRAGRRSA